MNTIEKRNIKFSNKIINGEVYKIAEGGIGHISMIYDIKTLDEFIKITDLALSGKFELIDNSDVSGEWEVAFVTPNGVEIYDDKVQNIEYIIPLIEFKDMLEAWKLFLNTPPLHGNRIY